MTPGIRDSVAVLYSEWDLLTLLSFRLLILLYEYVRAPVEDCIKSNLRTQRAVEDLDVPDFLEGLRRPRDTPSGETLILYLKMAKSRRKE